MKFDLVFGKLNIEDLQLYEILQLHLQAILVDS